MTARGAGAGLRHEEPVSLDSLDRRITDLAEDIGRKFEQQREQFDKLLEEQREQRALLERLVVLRGAK